MIRPLSSPKSGFSMFNCRTPRCAILSCVRRAGKTFFGCWPSMSAMPPIFPKAKIRRMKVLHSLIHRVFHRISPNLWINPCPFCSGELPHFGGRSPGRRRRKGQISEKIRRPFICCTGWKPGSAWPRHRNRAYSPGMWAGAVWRMPLIRRRPHGPGNTGNSPLR